MFRKSLYEELDNMSYEEQKALYGRIEDQQSYDDNCNVVEVLVSAIGVLLPLMVLIDTLADKSRKLNPVDKKTDWFYKSEQFDRKFDERADRNEYKF